ncbi:hypothetical protein DPMN_094422 [Dreissena polymorpha]|uniref:Uncharacterized protein n=1 Tax=Dreissena polymorpha TaxID=45954 RepID=A0A9D4L5Q3_DREPO|nr:hypothetical protein DPMN_094422 [Dreissena polymorpha]
MTEPDFHNLLLALSTWIHKQALVLQFCVSDGGDNSPIPGQSEELVILSPLGLTAHRSNLLLALSVNLYDTLVLQASVSVKGEELVLAMNVNVRVFTNQMWTDDQPTKTDPKTSPEQSAIFELVRDINKTNVFTKFHADWAKNVTSRVHVFQRTGTIFELHSCKTAPPTGCHVFSPIWTIFKLFHNDWAKIVTSRVFQREIAPPTCVHVFQWTGTTFEFNQHII